MHSEHLDGEGSSQPPLAKLRLFSPLQILFLSLFGTVLAGFVAFACNYQRLQQRRAFYVTLASGSILLPILTWVAITLPGIDRAWPIILAVLMFAMTELCQRTPIKTAFLTGQARPYGVWSVVGFAVMILIVVVIIGSVILLLL